MAQDEILDGSLLFHAAHGLCRADKFVHHNESGESVPSYRLVPKKENNMKTRITVAAVDIQNSGFHTLVSVEEANEILEYLVTGDRPQSAAPVIVKDGFADDRHPQVWDLARRIVSYDEANSKDQIKRQVLERSIKGLIGEIAFVFKITLKKAADRIQRCLGKKVRIDSLTLDILTKVGEGRSVGW